jgi:hypothetical protein
MDDGNKRLTRQQKLAALVAALRSHFGRQHFTAGSALTAAAESPELRAALTNSFRKETRHRTACGRLLRRAAGRQGELQLLAEWDGHCKSWQFRVEHDNDAADIQREQLAAEAREAAKREGYNVSRRLERSFLKHGVPSKDETPVTAEQCLEALKELHRKLGSPVVVKLLQTKAGADTWSEVHSVFYAPLLKEAKALTDATKSFGPTTQGMQEALHATAVYERKVAPPVTRAASEYGQPDTAQRVAEIEAELLRHGRTGVEISDVLEIDRLRGSPWRFGMSVNPADYRSYSDNRGFQQHVARNTWNVFD